MNSCMSIVARPTMIFADESGRLASAGGFSVLAVGDKVPMGSRLAELPRQAVDVIDAEDSGIRGGSPKQ